MTRSVLGTLARHAGQIRSGVLSVAGLGLITAAAFTFTTWAGLTVAGLSCLLIDLTRERAEEDSKPAGGGR